MTQQDGGATGGTDRPAIDRLLARAEQRQGHPPISEAKRLLLDRHGPSGRVLVLRRSPPSAGLRAVVVIAVRPDRWVLEVAVEDEPTDPDGGAFVDAVGRAVREATDHQVPALELWVPRAGPGTDGPLAGLGFRPERDLLHMRCRLPLAAPDPGLALRAFRPGLDESAWLALNRRAFADHPEQGGWTLDDLRQRENEGWFDPDGFLLLEEEGRLTAACWTKRYPPDPTGERRGEIYVIGVDPDHQGRGLGRALTVAGLRYLASVGADTGVLYVDAANQPAVALYRSLGFTVDHVDRAYLRTGPPDR